MKVFNIVICSITCAFSVFLHAIIIVNKIYCYNILISNIIDLKYEC